MERIVNSRLMWHLEEKRLLSPKQAGFRKYMSTEDQVAHIAQGIEDAFQEGSQTVAVWVDMEKAFDKVWHDGLRLKLLKAGVSGKIYQWTSHLLANRTARVQLQGHTSRKSQIQNGVPQGGVLSPTLLLIYINDIT
jgi:retron-type reverse transcriptase